MSDREEPKSNIVDIFSRKKDQGLDADLEIIMNMSDDIDDVVNGYIEIGIHPDAIAAILANRLGVLLAAMNSAGISDPIQIYLDIVADTAKEKLGE